LRVAVLPVLVLRLVSHGGLHVVRLMIELHALWQPACHRQEVLGFPHRMTSASAPLAVDLVTRRNEWKVVRSWTTSKQQEREAVCGSATVVRNQHPLQWRFRAAQMGHDRLRIGDRQLHLERAPLAGTSHSWRRGAARKSIPSLWMCRSCWRRMTPEARPSPRSSFRK
jgi:hypothetical protein